MQPYRVDAVALYTTFLPISHPGSFLRRKDGLSAKKLLGPLGAHRVGLALKAQICLKVEQ